jgi:hypothetical protein
VVEEKVFLVAVTVSFVGGSKDQTVYDIVSADTAVLAWHKSLNYFTAGEGAAVVFGDTLFFVNTILTVTPTVLAAIDITSPENSKWAKLLEAAENWEAKIKAALEEIEE